MNICNALATGLIQPWIPPPQPRDAIVPTEPGEEAAGRGSAKKRGVPAAGAAAKKPASVSIAPEATADLKRAIEVKVPFTQYISRSNFRN